MIDLDWQTSAVLVVVVAACAYLARAAWQTMARRKAGACGGCGTCPSNSRQDEPPVIAVGQLAETAKTDAREGAVHDRARRE